MANEWSWGLIALWLFAGFLLLGTAFYLYISRRRIKAIRHELQTILDTLEPVALIDTNYNIIRVNQLYAAALGRSFNSVIGSKCYRVHENRDTPCPGCQLYKAVVEKKPQLMPSQQWTREGHTIWYDVSFHPVIQDEKVQYVVETKKDITTLHNIKTTLEEQKMDLERKTRELREKNEALSGAYLQIEESLEEKNQDFEMAREIQQSLLPDTPSQLGTVCFWSTYNPIQQVGGDLYDFISLGDHRLGVFLGDVSGHGLPAAFIAALTKLSLHNHLERFLEPKWLMTQINQDLRQHLKTGHYLTTWFGIFDFKTNKLTYVRGSHPPPVILRADVPPIKLDAKGMLIGLLPDPEFLVHEVQLLPGDRLCLFTDGCFSVPDEDGSNPMSYTRYVELLHIYSRLPLDSIYGALNLRIQQDFGQFEMDDDRTFLMMEVRKTPLQERYRYLLHFCSRDSIHRSRIRSRKEMDSLIDQVVEVMETFQYQERAIAGICNSIQEVVVNALVHGHKGNTKLKCMVAWSVTESEFRCSVTDKGDGFDPQDLSQRREHRGNGLLLVRTYMDDVFFDNQGRTVTLHKVINSSLLGTAE